MSNNLNIDEKINETNENLDIATEDVNKDEVAMEDNTYNTTNVDGNQNRYDYSTRNSADTHSHVHYQGAPNIRDNGDFVGMMRGAAATGLRDLVGSAYRVFEPVVTNVLFTFWDMLNNPKGAMPLGSNVITLICVVSDDLPIDVRNMYCKSLEVINAMTVRSLIMSSIEGRLTASTPNLYRKLPFMTSFDSVEFDKAKKAYKTIGDSVFSRKFNGSQVIDNFAEAFIENLDKHFKFKVSMEEAVMRESSTGSVPTYVEAEVTILLDNGAKAHTKKYMMGVQVIPKVVPANEIAQMFIKQNNRIIQAAQEASRSWWDKLKSVFTFKSKEAIKAASNEGNKVAAKVLNDNMNAVAAIKKPFVNILMSNNVAEMLQDVNFDITSRSNVSKMYNNLPLMSIGVYDINTDTITASMNRSPIFTKRTASEFNSEASKLQKDLAELLRIKKLS